MICVERFSSDGGGRDGSAVGVIGAAPGYRQSEPLPSAAPPTETALPAQAVALFTCDLLHSVECNSVISLTLLQTCGEMSAALDMSRSSLSPGVYAGKKSLLDDLAQLLRTRLQEGTSDPHSSSTWVHSEAPSARALPASAQLTAADPDSDPNDHEKSSVKSIQILLQQQKDLSSVEVEEETRHHGLLTAELADLTEVLKETTMQMSASISQQNLVSTQMLVECSTRLTRCSHWRRFNHTQSRTSTK